MGPLWHSGGAYASPHPSVPLVNHVLHVGENLIGVIFKRLLHHLPANFQRRVFSANHQRVDVFLPSHSFRKSQQTRTVLSPTANSSIRNHPSFFIQFQIFNNSRNQCHACISRTQYLISNMHIFERDFQILCNGTLRNQITQKDLVKRHIHKSPMEIVLHQLMQFAHSQSTDHQFKLVSSLTKELVNFSK